MLILLLKVKRSMAEISSEYSNSCTNIFSLDSNCREPLMFILYSFGKITQELFDKL